MEKIYLLIFFLLSILTLVFFEFILIIGTTFLIIFLALVFALESNARDLKNINYFKNNQLFNLKNEINLVSRKNFISLIFLDKIVFLKNLKNSSQFFFDKKKNLNEDKLVNEIYTGDTRIDEQINDLINLVLRDYVFSWYSALSSNHEFINELKLVLQKIIKLIVFRISKIDKINFITTKLVDNFVQHLKLFRLAKHHLKENKIEITNENLKKSFFKFEYENESKNFSRNKICEDENFFISFCSEIISILEYLILPNDLFKNRPLNYLVNSILLKTIFLPIFQLITDPDFINQCLISLCKSRKTNMSLSECFLIVLRSNANKDELLAVLESLKEEISLQRSKDAGGDDDFEIKQQLNSMYYVTSIIKERLKILDEGYLNMVESKTNFLEENDNSNNQLNKTELVNLAFDFVITNPLALTFFFEYMSKINKQCYLNFYLGVEGFRVSVEQKMIAIQMRENKELENLKKIYDYNDIKSLKKNKGNENFSVVETNSDKSDLISSSEISDKEEKKNIYSSIEEIDEKLILFSSIDEQVRDEALLLYKTYLSSSCSKNNQLDIDKQLIEELKFKIENDELSETWFDTIHQLVYRKLREDKFFFESFKKSIHYYKLCKELGLLKDNSWKEKSSVVDPSLNNSQFYVDLDNDLNSLKSFKSGETDSSSSLKDQKVENINLINQKSFKSNSFNKLEADIISTGITKEFGTSYGVYCIKVLKKDLTEINKPKESKWFVVRRYSDFYTFHQQTIKLFPKLNTISLPSKKPFMSISQEFLEHRKHSLNLYLKNLLKIVNEDKCFSENSTGFDKNKLYDHFLNFFEEGNFIPKDRINGIQLFAKTINSVFNPFKISLKPAEKNKSNLLSGFKNLKPFGSSNIPTTSSSSEQNNQDDLNQYSQKNQFTKSSSSSSLSNLQSSQQSPNFKRSFKFKNQNDLNSKSNKSTSLIETETNIPLRILLLLMDEIFDLKSKSFWLRRRIFNVIKQIIQTTYGNALNRKIIAFINRLFSPSSISEYIKTLKKTLWPKGYKAIPKDERDKPTKLRTKIATKMLLLSIVPDDLMHVVGGETSRKSVISLFNMLQISVLNKRLMVVVLEKLLIELFPENNFDKIFEKLHLSTTKYEEKSFSDIIWPPCLNKINIKSNLSSYSNTNSDQSSNKTSP